MSIKYVILGTLLLFTGLVIGLVVAPGERAPSDEGRQAVSMFCVEHGVAESVCTRCNPELIPGFKEKGDWCREHDVAESQCSLCNPQLADLGVLAPILDNVTAAGNGVVGSFEITDEDAGYAGLSIIYRTNSPSCPTDQAIIQLASVETAERAGIEVQPVIVDRVTQRFEAPAEVVFDQNQTTTLTSSLAVTVTRWYLDPGLPVQKGDAIAAADSPDMAQLQGEYLEAWSDDQIHRRELERGANLLAKGLIDSASYDRISGEAISAEAEFVQAASRLQLAGLSSSDLVLLQQERQGSSRFDLRASSNGMLLERVASLGKLLGPGDALARIGDPSALWIEARVRTSDLPRVTLRQTVEFSADGNALRRVSGEVIWVSPYLDPHTRTAIVRAVPTSNSSFLRAHEFGRLSLLQEVNQYSVMVPIDAVQWDGCCNVVFVREAPDIYRPQKVEIALGEQFYYRVLSGLQPDDEVVVRGSFLLKTELKKGSIGAGCCGLKPTS